MLLPGGAISPFLGWRPKAIQTRRRLSKSSSEVTQWLKRIRGAIGIGLTWAAVWFGAGILLARVPGFYSDLPFAPLGFVTGVS